MTQVQWDEAWQRFYHQGLRLGMTPNKAAHRANDEMTNRHGERPEEKR